MPTERAAPARTVLLLQRRADPAAGAAGLTRYSGTPLHADLLSLQRQAGNGAVTELLTGSTGAHLGDAAAGRTTVQRWSLVTDAWSTITDTAKKGWDYLTGGGSPAPTSGSKPAAQLVELEGFDPALHVEVTDPQAAIRRPPPTLTLTSKGKEHVIPKGLLVHVLEAVQKGSTQYVLVRDVLVTEPLGWTKASNIPGLTLRAKSGGGSGGGVPGGGPTPGSGDDANLADEITRVDEMEISFEERSEEDKKKIAKVTEQATNTKLADHGPTAEQWFADLYPGATFLGIAIDGQEKFRGEVIGGVHKELYDRLKRVEQLLMTETGKDEAGTAEELGLRTVGGLRPGSGSLHTFGLAIDVNADRSNPWLRASSQAPVQRATQLVSKSAVDVLAHPTKQSGTTREQRAKQARQMYAELSSVATALDVYFRFRSSTSVTLGDDTILELADLASAYAAATGESRTVAQWQEQIAEDHKTLVGGNYGKRRDPAKESATMDLDQRLVMAMAKAGLTWGGTLGAQGKDVMHFDLRDGTIKGPRPSNTAPKNTG